MKKIFVLLLSVTVFLGLMGCVKGNEAQMQVQEGPLNYIGDNKGIFTPQALPLDSRFYVRELAPCGGGFILWVMEDKQDKLLSYNLSEETFQELDLIGSLMPGSMSYDDQGNVCILCTQVDGSYSIITIKPDLNMQVVGVQAGDALEKSSANAAYKVPGGFLLETYTEVLYLDSQGKLIKELIQAPALSDISIVHTSTDPVIVIISNESGTYIKVYDQNMELKGEYNIENSYTSYFSGQDTVYAKDSSAVFALDYTTGQRQAYVSITASGMFSQSFVELDGVIYTSSQGRLTRWIPAGEQEIVTLKMAVYGDSMVISNLVNSYNRVSTQCRIDVVNYSSFNTSDNPRQGVEQLHLDLVNGEGPDIIELSSFYPNFYAAKGILADLEPFFEADEELSLEDLNSAMVDLGTFNGGFYELSPSFCLYTTACDKSIAKGKLTLEAFSAMAEEYGMAALFGPTMTRGQFLENCLALDCGLVDYENAQCTFDREVFIEMLKLSSQLPDQPGEGSGGLIDSYTGQSMLALMELGTDTVGMVCYLDKIFSGDAQFVGFPVQKGSGTAAIPSCRFAICGISANPGAAWDFMRFLLSDTVQNDRQLTPGLPIVTAAMENRLTELAQHYQDDKMIFYASVDGTPVEISPRPADERTLDKIRIMANQMDAIAQVDGSIMEIIMREAEKYYAGQISAQDAGTNIQSRVSIYLAEQYG